MTVEKLQAEIDRLKEENNRMRSTLVDIKSVADRRDSRAGDRGWIGFECGKALAKKATL